MSQVKFSVPVARYSGQNVEVLAGWDHPLSRYFMVVEVATGNGEEETLYSNLSDPELNQRGKAVQATDTDYFKAKLTYLGVTPPEGFWERVEKKERNVGWLHQDGAWVRL